MSCFARAVERDFVDLGRDTPPAGRVRRQFGTLNTGHAKRVAARHLWITIPDCDKLNCPVFAGELELSASRQCYGVSAAGLSRGRPQAACACGCRSVRFPSGGNRADAMTSDIRMNGLKWAIRLALAAAALAVGATASAQEGMPLHRAAEAGQAGSVARLLREADPDTVDKWGGTPLHSAAVNGHDIVARLLLGVGANPDAVRSDGSTPLHSAAANGHARVALSLLKASADPDAASDDGDRPLHIAAFRGHDVVVLALLEAGANPNAAVNATGETPLFLAIDGGHDAVARLLFNAGGKL